MINKNILTKSVQDFINQNLNIAIDKLLFSKPVFENINNSELADQIVAKNKCIKKLPLWFRTSNIYLPKPLSIEQSSSEKSAKYKASLVRGKSLIDLTGGFGVDDYYFAQKIDKVIHCEINKELSEIVKHNTSILKANNIECKNLDSTQYIKENKNKYDWIFIDPSRRNKTKGKVFLIEDCSPNLPEILDDLLDKSENIMVKFAPMLDISEALRKIPFIYKVEVVAVDNNVKEILLFINKKESNDIFYRAINITKHSNDIFDYYPLKTHIPTYSTPKKYLFEPNSAINKTGAFLAICSKFEIDKLSKNSHLYTSEKLIDFPGRRFEIIETAQYKPKLLKNKFKDNKANIAIKNFPDSVEKIRKKTKIKDGGNDYVFFTKDINDKPMVLICKQIF
ncbi:MAG: class I SAM-dependent methyltransferase [Flavobacteriaceae bacterium]|nr:class I SAM-dependent methyltransferase [Flavobacteriaceae bacterium]